jgi:peptidoglycan lytic transglycosylase
LIAAAGSLKGFCRLAGLATVLAVLAGCGHHRATSVAPTPSELAPLPAANTASTPTYVPGAKPPAIIPITPAPPGGVDAADMEFVATHTPIMTEEGLATWYRAPYKGRKSANGQVFEDDAMTAAHRTLPMGSLVEVTNLKTGQSAVMRITDRGPFVEDRMLDLTVAAAKAVGIYRVGMAQVRMDVYQTPKPIDSGGRWCVQIGAFHSERDAMKLKEQLMRKYSDANVIEFPGTNSYWVRIRPEGDDRSMAEYIARHLQPSEGEAYLTRLD